MLRVGARGFIRPFRDDTSIRCPIRWYRVPADRPNLGIPTIFGWDEWGARDHIDDAYPAVEKAFVYDKGIETSGARGLGRCGTADQWSEGCLTSDPVPAINPETGVFVCCGLGVLAVFGGEGQGGHELLIPVVQALAGGEGQGGLTTWAASSSAAGGEGQGGYQISSISSVLLGGEGQGGNVSISQAAATPVVVQGAYAGDAVGFHNFFGGLQFAFPVTAGNVVLVLVQLDSANAYTGNGGTLNDNFGNTWTYLTSSSLANTSGYKQAYYWSHIAVGGSMHLTYALSGGALCTVGGISIAAIELSGVTNCVLDTVLWDSVAAAGGVFSASPITTAQAVEVALAGCDCTVGPMVTCPPPTGFTTLGVLNFGNFQDSPSAAWKITTSALSAYVAAWHPSGAFPPFGLGKLSTAAFILS